MTHGNQQDQAPTPVDIGGILKHFFEHSPVNWQHGYDLLSEVSDKELELFDHVIEKTDLATPDSESVLVCKVIQ